MTVATPTAKGENGVDPDSQRWNGADPGSQRWTGAAGAGRHILSVTLKIANLGARACA